MTTSPSPFDTRLCDDLVNVRDWLRYAVTCFETANLAYGHGTDNAVDEAAFLVLALLNLPIDDAGPWLDCRLTRAERQGLAQIIQDRVTTRRPAPYLVRQAWIGPHRFYVDERVIVPRSFIGELLARGELSQFIPAPGDVAHILELCTGSGCLAILAALEFPEAHIVALDISRDALDVARLNVADYGLDGRIELLESDLLEAVPQQRFDLIIANPPYVTQSAVSAFPPEYRAEPQVAHLGGKDGLDIVLRILDVAAQWLTATGVIVMEIGQGREALEAARPDLPFLWIDTQTSEGEVFALTACELNETFTAKPSNAVKARLKPPRAKSGKKGAA